MSTLVVLAKSSPGYTLSHKLDTIQSNQVTIYAKIDTLMSANDAKIMAFYYYTNEMQNVNANANLIWKHESDISSLQLDAVKFLITNGIPGMELKTTKLDEATAAAQMRALFDSVTNK